VLVAGDPRPEVTSLLGCNPETITGISQSLVPSVDHPDVVVAISIEMGEGVVVAHAIAPGLLVGEVLVVDGRGKGVVDVSNNHGFSGGNVSDKGASFDSVGPIFDALFETVTFLIASVDNSRDDLGLREVIEFGPVVAPGVEDISQKLVDHESEADDEESEQGIPCCGGSHGERVDDDGTDRLTSKDSGGLVGLELLAETRGGNFLRERDVPPGWSGGSLFGMGLLVFLLGRGGRSSSRTSGTHGGVGESKGLIIVMQIGRAHV